MDSRVGMFGDERVYPFTSAGDLLRFDRVSLLTRLRLGLTALWLRRVSDWRRYEGMKAKDWITSKVGKEGYERVWGPLLRAKFGRHAPEVAMVWFWGKIYLRFASRKGGPLAKEQLGYLRGSFGRMVDALVEAIRERGGSVQAGRPVQRIVSEDGRVRGVELAPAEDGGEPEFLEADAVIATVHSGVLPRIAPDLPEDYQALLGQVEYQWATVLLLALDRPLSEIYWLTITDDDCPFVVAVEQTNFRDPSEYGGQHIVYFSNYADPGDPVVEEDVEQVLERYEPYIPPHQPRVRSQLDPRQVAVQGPRRPADRALALPRDDSAAPHRHRGLLPGQQHPDLPGGPRPELHDAHGHRSRTAGDGGRWSHHGSGSRGWRGGRGVSRKKPPDEPGQDVESAAIACLVISDVLLDIADRAFERKRDGAEAAEFATWLAECYEEMATGASGSELEGVAMQELLGGEPAAEAIAWVAEQLDHEAAYLRGRALTPGAEAERLAARGAEKLVELLRQTVAKLEGEGA